MSIAALLLFIRALGLTVPLGLVAGWQRLVALGVLWVAFYAFYAFYFATIPR